VIYERAKGPIPDGYLVLHRCDNPPCVNPQHLWAGTKQDNSDDKIAKGRGRWVKHEHHPQAKLTATEVELIRSVYARGGWTLTALGALFGVNRSTVRGIIDFKNWR
jgi:hypothetical protein